MFKLDTVMHCDVLISMCIISCDLWYPSLAACVSNFKLFEFVLVGVLCCWALRSILDECQDSVLLTAICSHISYHSQFPAEIQTLA